MKLNEEKLNQLEAYYWQAKESVAIFLSGDKGLGKTYTINQFLSDKDNILSICVFDKSAYTLEPIVTAINQYYWESEKEVLFETKTGLSVAEQITKEMLSICKEKRIILYFESITRFAPELLDYIRSLLHSLINHYHSYQTFILFEVDTNSDRNFEYQQKLDSIYAVSPNFKFVPYSPIEHQVLKQYLFSIFNGKIDIRQEDLSYILDSSFGNLMYINIIVNYLKQSKKLVCENGDYHCLQIEKGFFSHILNNYIMQRYNRLDEDMKLVLDRSSIIGIQFEKHLLYNPFNILEADEYLKRIEYITQLIQEKPTNCYSFENRLGKLKLLDEKITEMVINHTYKAAHHYEKSLLLDKAIHHYLKLIALHMNIMDYSSALNCIVKTKKILCKLEGTKDVYSIILRYEADCHRFLGRYAEAIPQYRECLTRLEHTYFRSELTQLQLNLAYSYYMNGDLPTAMKLTLDLKSKLQKDSHDALLFYQVLSFLSSIYHLVGKDGEASEYYNWTLEYCRQHGLEEEYYFQLRKASMVMDLELAQPMMREASEYLRKTKNIKALAETDHNLATDGLYLMQLDHIKMELEESISIYSEYGSSLVHYPLNTKAIYIAVIDQDYLEAIKTWEKILTYDVEPFSQIAVYTNLATCYRKLDQMDQAKAWIEKADELIDLAEDEDIVLLPVYHYINWALYLKAKGQYSDALHKLTECAQNCRLYPRHQFIVYRQQLHLAQKMGLEITEQMQHNGRIVSYPLLTKYVENDLFFATIRFYE